MRISDWGSYVCSSDLPIAVEIRPDVGRSLTCDHDVRIDELHSLPKAEIDIADVASSENAGGSVCRERLVVHSPVQADEVEGVAQRLQRDRKSTRLNSSH